jgi:mRNA interferase MazF
VPFPFSDRSQAKRRPALVLAELGGDDVILCQFTSRAVRDRYAVPIDERAFEEGGLSQPSNVRPNRVFTADRSLVLYRAGRLRAETTAEVVRRLVHLLET